MPTQRNRSRLRSITTLIALGAFLLALVSIAPAASAAPAPTSLAKNCIQQGKALYSTACQNLQKKECEKAVFAKHKTDCIAYADAASRKGFVGMSHDFCPHIWIIRQDCKPLEALAKGTAKGVQVAQDPGASLAAAAFNATSREFGNAAVDVLREITDVFLKESTIDLSSSGVQTTYGMLWGLSGLIAVILLLLQFAKVAITASGQAAATALVGLARWALICMAGIAVTQTALYASDDISEWLITRFYKDHAGFQKRLGASLIAFLTSQGPNPALILVCAVLAIVALVCLWGEMLMRAAAIQVLVACLPIAAAGTMMDGSKEWFPKTRNAIVSLILIKPVIVLIFVIGFGEFSDSTSLEGFLVGLLTLVLAVFAWPALAKFMTFTTAGGGSSFLSGFLGAVGGTAAGMAMGGTPSGLSALGGKAFTKGMESENDAAAAGGKGGGKGRGGGGALGSVAGGLSLGTQGLKAGKEQIEGGMEAMAAHADLGPGKDMGGQITPPRGEAGGEAPPPAPSPAPTPAPAPAPAPALGPGTESPTVTLDRVPPTHTPLPGSSAAQLTRVPPPKIPSLPPPPSPNKPDGGSGT